jgi:dihydropteroate synthase
MIWKIKNKQIEYGKNVLIMGIVNVTPDSFSDGGNWFSTENAVSHALELVEQGADILDFGAQSTRPNYTEISPQEEWARLEPVLTQIKDKTNVPISIDTYFPYVAENALNCGADIINDVSGVITDEMAQIVKNTGCGWILMHNGSGSVAEVKDFFEKSIEKCQSYGIDESQICLDMGIGFGKDYEQNLQLLSNVKSYKIEGYPLLLGTSRKRVIGQSSKQDVASERVYGNIAADTVAILGGVDIIRLHDVKNEKQGILTAQELKRAGINNG